MSDMKNEKNQEQEEIQELKLPLNIIGKISKLFVNRFELTLLMVGLLVVLGITSYILLPKESLPEIVFPTLTVQTVYPGASPTDVEALVTKPIEDGLSGLDQVTDIGSVSNDSFSFVTVSFEEGVDIDRKQVELEGALASVKLPDGALDSKVSTFKTSEIPLISMSLAGDYTIYQLTDYAEILAGDLEKISGVEDVAVIGGSSREIQILLDQDKANALGITMDTVATALKSQNISTPVGEIAQTDGLYKLRIDEALNSLDQLQTIQLNTNRGNLVYLRDVAQIVDTNKALTQYNRSFTKESGLQTSILLSVVRQNKADIPSTSQSIKDQIEKSIGTSIPSDLSVVISRDTAVQVKEDIDSIQSNALSGLLVVILVLFLFIGFRESLVVAVTIPLTLFGTLGVLSLFGITLNTFAILGLIVALGLLVDNSIIVMENMDRLSKKGASAKDSAVYGTNQVGFPIVSATLTTVAAFFPLAILPGIVGAFINTIPRTIIITLMTSLLIAIVITPSVYYIIFKKVATKERVISRTMEIAAGVLKVLFVGGLSAIAFYGKGVFIGIPIVATLLFASAMFVKVFFGKKSSSEDSAIIKGYKAWLLTLIQSRLRIFAMLLVAVGVLVSSVLLITSGQLKIAFFPQNQPTSVVMEVDAAPGTSLSGTDAIVEDIENQLIKAKDVAQFNTTIGQNGSNTAVIRVDLLANGVDGFTQLENIQNSVKSDRSTITFQAQGAGGPPVGKPIEVKIQGQNLEANKAYVDELAKRLSNVEGTYNVESSLKEGGQELLMDIQNGVAKGYGLTPATIAFSFRAQLEGTVATTLNTEDGLVDIRVLNQDRDLESILAREMMLPGGQSISFGEVITLTESTGVSSITRESGVRTITLTSDLKEGINAADALEQFKASITNLTVPEGTTLVYGGEAAGISENFANLFRSLILAMFLVVAILTIQFGSIKQPLIIMTTIPMALIGVLYGLTITGNEFGFYAFMALISLVGIAVNDAIVLIDYTNYLRKEGMPFFEAVAEATITRLGPVFATTLTTIGGILPLSFRSAYYAQFGYALVFGLLVTTFMTLVMIPSLYALFEGKKARKEQKAMKKQDSVVIKFRPVEENGR